MDGAAFDALPADSLPADLAEAVDRTAHSGARIALTRNGKPVAVLVPVEDAEALEAMEDMHWSQVAREAMAEWEAEGKPLGATLEEVMARFKDDPAGDKG